MPNSIVTRELGQGVLPCYLFSFGVETFRNIREFGGKKNSTDHRKTNTIQLFVAIKGTFSGLFFF